jgi:hypothetical protein
MQFEAVPEVQKTHIHLSFAIMPIYKILKMVISLPRQARDKQIGKAALSPKQEG